MNRTLPALKSIWQKTYHVLEGENKMIWLITGTDCKDFIVDAESFDEALRIARLVNRNYTTGQVIG